MGKYPSFFTHVNLSFARICSKLFGISEHFDHVTIIVISDNTGELYYINILLSEWQDLWISQFSTTKETNSSECPLKLYWRLLFFLSYVSWVLTFWHSQAKVLKENNLFGSLNSMCFMSTRINWYYTLLPLVWWGILEMCIFVIIMDLFVCGLFSICSCNWIF